MLDNHNSPLTRKLERLWGSISMEAKDRYFILCCPLANLCLKLEDLICRKNIVCWRKRCSLHSTQCQSSMAEPIYWWWIYCNSSWSSEWEITAEIEFQNSCAVSLIDELWQWHASTQFISMQGFECNGRSWEHCSHSLKKLKIYFNSL